MAMGQPDCRVAQFQGRGGRSSHAQGTRETWAKIWADREEKLREEEWQAAEQMLAKIQQMLKKLSVIRQERVTEEVGNGDGSITQIHKTIIHPSRFDFGTAFRGIELVCKLRGWQLAGTWRKPLIVWIRVLEFFLPYSVSPARQWHEAEPWVKEGIVIHKRPSTGREGPKEPFL